MLQIYIYGPSQSGFLDLEEGAVLSIESVADIFDEDLSTGDFSLPGKAPWTDNNKKLLGFAERLSNNLIKVTDYKCIVYDSGFPEIPMGKFTIIGKSGSFNYRQGSFDFTIAGTKGLFGTQIKNKYLTDLNLGGKISWDGMDSRHFAESLMKGNYPEYPHITFVPVAIENFFDTSRPDYDNEFLAKDTVNNIIVTGSGADAWTFARPQSTDASLPAVQGTMEYNDYRTIPFIRTKYLIQKIFEENGYKVSGEFLDSPDYDKLTVFNNYAIENYSPTTYIDFNRSIIPANHVPKILVLDYLKGLLGLFNMYLVFTGDNQVQMLFRKKFSKKKKVLSVNGIISDKFTSNITPQDNGNGYTLAYDWGGDDYPGDRVKDLKDKIISGIVPTLADLATISNAGLTTDHVAYVEAENMYYQVADATTNPVKWDCYSEALDEYKSGNGERPVDIPIGTLCQYVLFDATAALFFRTDYLGARMQGSYLNNKGVRVVSAFTNKIFFAGKHNNSSNVSVPFSYNHNRDASNKVIFPFTLAWTTSTGMAAIYHDEWQRMKQNMETVKANLSADRKVLNDIITHDFIEQDNVMYMLSKVDRDIPLSKNINVEMVPLS